MTQAQPHILIVDDDAEIRDLLGQFLEEHGFQTTLAKDGEQLFEHFTPDTYDLLILDLMLPGEDGLTLCRKIRAQSSIPIIMLTAVGADIDRIVGLEMGADDYIGKPFNPRELLARIRAILRRSIQHTSQDMDIANKHEVYTFAGWTLDRTARRLLTADEVEITLSAGEFDLLMVLVEHAQKVLSRDQLLDLTRNREAGPFDRSIDIQISRIRHKIEENPKKPALIKTVRSGGYVLSCVVVKSLRQAI